MIGIDQAAIARFNGKHDVTEDQQFKALVEEVGELSEALYTDGTDEQVAEEIADVLFVCRSLAELRDIDIGKRLNTVIEENIQKDESRNGEKVTKQGLR